MGKEVRSEILWILINVAAFERGNKYLKKYLHGSCGSDIKKIIGEEMNDGNLEVKKNTIWLARNLMENDPKFVVQLLETGFLGKLTRNLESCDLREYGFIDLCNSFIYTVAPQFQNDSLSPALYAEIVDVISILLKNVSKPTEAFLYEFIYLLAFISVNQKGTQAVLSRGLLDKVICCLKLPNQEVTNVSLMTLTHIFYYPSRDLIGYLTDTDLLDNTIWLLKNKKKHVVREVMVLYANILMNEEDNDAKKAEIFGIFDQKNIFWIILEVLGQNNIFVKDQQIEYECLNLFRIFLIHGGSDRVFPWLLANINF